jgi:hypothetical protein
VDEDTEFELWKAIESVQRLLSCYAQEHSNKNIAEMQQHYLEGSVDPMKDGIHKRAAIAAFREVALRTPKSRSILAKYTEN